MLSTIQLSWEGKLDWNIKFCYQPPFIVWLVQTSRTALWEGKKCEACLPSQLSSAEKKVVLDTYINAHTQSTDNANVVSCITMHMASLYLKHQKRLKWQAASQNTYINTHMQSTDNAIVVSCITMHMASLYSKHQKRLCGKQLVFEVDTAQGVMRSGG